MFVFTVAAGHLADRPTRRQRQCHRERKCADTVGTVLVPSVLAISSAKIDIFSNKIYGSNFIKQHSETVMV